MSPDPKQEEFDRSPEAGCIKRHLDELFAHVTPACNHTFTGWRPFEDGNGGEQVCSKCGIGAMAWSLRVGP